MAEGSGDAFSRTATATFECSNCSNEVALPHAGVCSSCGSHGQLCEPCLNLHLKIPPALKLRDHGAAKAEHIVDREALVAALCDRQPRDRCIEHLKAFFSLCKSHGVAPVPVCPDCVDAHSRHDLVGVSKGGSEARAELRATATDILARVTEDARLAAVGANRDLDALEESAEVSREAVTAARDMALAAVADHFGNLQATVESVRLRCAEAIVGRRQAADALLQTAALMQANVLRAAAVFSDLDAAVLAPELAARAQQLGSQAADMAAAAATPHPRALHPAALVPQLQSVLAALQSVDVSRAAAEVFPPLDGRHGAGNPLEQARAEMEVLRRRIVVLEGDLKRSSALVEDLLDAADSDGSETGAGRSRREAASLLRRRTAAEAATWCVTRDCESHAPTSSSFASFCLFSLHGRDTAALVGRAENSDNPLIAATASVAGADGEPSLQGPAAALAVEGVVVWVDAAAHTAGVVRAGGGISCRAIQDIECDAEDHIRAPAVPAASAAASPAASSSDSSCAWRSIREADFPALVGQRVRLLQGDAAARLAGDAEGGPLGSRAERRSGIITTADATDCTVCVDDAWWYRGQDLEVQALPPSAAAAAVTALAAAASAGVRWRRATVADVPTLVGRRVRFRAARVARSGAARPSTVAAGLGHSGTCSASAADPQDSLAE